MKHYITPFLNRIIILFITIMMNYGTALSQSMPDLAANNLQLPARAYNIPFYWQGDSVNMQWEPHTAMLIPVKLPGCPKQFYMQFDLGSPYSLFYKNKITAIRSKYPKTKLNNKDSLQNFSFTAGKMPVLAKKIVVKQFDNTGIDWNKNDMEIIGTLGTDLIDGKTVVIDYPKQRLTLSSSVSGKLSTQVSLTDMLYFNRRILLPASILGKRTMLYFDTGSSMYELLTNKQTCEIMAIPGSIPLQSKVNSWGKLLIVNTYPSNDSISINQKNIYIHNVSYIEVTNATQAEQMIKMGIGGMTGNKLFLNYKLVLDTKNKKFGLIR